MLTRGPDFYVRLGEVGAMMPVFIASFCVLIHFHCFELSVFPDLMLLIFVTIRYGSSFDAKVNRWPSNRSALPDVFVRCGRLQNRQLR